MDLPNNAILTRRNALAGLLAAASPVAAAAASAETDPMSALRIRFEQARRDEEKATTAYVAAIDAREASAADDTPSARQYRKGDMRLDIAGAYELHLAGGGFYSSRDVARHREVLAFYAELNRTRPLNSTSCDREIRLQEIVRSFDAEEARKADWDRWYAESDVCSTLRAATNRVREVVEDAIAAVLGERILIEVV